MAYASVEDWLSAEAEQAHLAHDEAGEVDRVLIASALSFAADEMHGWLASRVDVLPVTDEQAVKTLRVHVIAMATYHMARTINSMTEGIKERYEQAIAYLKAVSAGRADLPMSSSGIAHADGDVASGGDIGFSAAPRRLTRESLRGM